MLVSLLVAVAGFLISAILAWRFSRRGSVGFILDHPGDRSLHSQPIPRGGGLAMLMALVIGAPPLALMLRADWSVWLGMGLIFLMPVAYRDDRGHVPAGYRLLAQALAAGCLLAGGFVPPAFELPGTDWAWSQPLAALLCAVFVVWMVNLYNFMDGMDGFAAGMAVFGFGTLALLAWQAGAEAYAGLALITASTSAGFLFFNFPPARIFMGDVGSTLLGFLAAALILWGARDGIFPIWVGILVFSPFIVDATATLIWRLGRREEVWRAHREHCYQHLVMQGWGHRRTVLWGYGLMALCSTSALVVVRLGVVGQWVVICAWIAVYGALIWGIRRL